MITITPVPNTKVIKDQSLGCLMRLVRVDRVSVEIYDRAIGDTYIFRSKRLPKRVYRLLKRCGNNATIMVNPDAFKSMEIVK